MMTFSALVLSKIAEAFLGALAGKITDEVWSKLQRDPARNALKQALGAAIQRYERFAQQHWRLELVSPLLQQDGLLVQPSVAEELAQIVRFKREPNYNLIGQQWRAYINSPPPWCNFTDEVKRLVEFFREELRRTEAFRPVFVQITLDAIAAGSTSSAESLTAIEGQLADLISLLSSGFKTLAQDFFRALPNVSSEIRDYTRYIEEKTKDFVGRDFIFDQIRDFTGKQSQGYFVVRGDPGVGKTSFAAQLVKVQGLVHHFNIRSMGINKTDLFLRNICAQLIAKYKLEHPLPTERMLQDSGFLLTLLSEVSHKLQVNEKAIIVVDALDEVDNASLASVTNVLYLPEFLPENIYFIATVRRDAPVKLPVEHHSLFIEPNSPENKADIRKFIEHALARPGIQAYISAQGINKETFVDHLEDKSEGNFMYLRYILPDIENGIYNDLKFESLPTGLKGYYEVHWQRMHGEDDEIWFKYKLPVLMALAAGESPLTIDMIQEFSRVKERARVVALLQEGQWGQFLHKEEVLSGTQKRYSIYHASFREFLAKKEEIREEGVSFIKARKYIIASYQSSLKIRGGR